ncbi:MAG TPA: MFS transporter [Thermomicrobiales bacterium]|nr:MFS transporter [Thermomicrobiales bacterium]
MLSRIPMRRRTSPAAPSPDSGRVWRSLREYPAFRLLLLGTLATNSAFWMYQVSVGWLALQMMNSPLFVGLTGFVSGIPLLLVSLPAGVIIDRYDRRAVLLVAQLAVMVVAGMFALLVGTSAIAPWSILVLAAAYGTAMSFIFPTRTTIVTMLVERDDLANAVALNAAGQNACRVTGPALAGVLIAVIGVAGTFAVAALLQILALAATLQLPSSTPAGTARGGSAWASLTLGLRIVARDAFLSSLILLAVATNVLVMPYITMMPVFARDELGVGSTGLGLLLASTGLGTVAGALAVAASRRLGSWAIAQVVTAVAFAGLVLVFALTRNLPLAVLLLFAAGGMSAAFMAITQTALQLRVDDDVRGRVLSIYLATWGMLPFGQLAVGAIADRAGAPLATVTACAVALGSVGLITRHYRLLRS